MPDWKSFEGELLDGKYPLERYAGGDDASAVFLIGFAATAVRIHRADAGQAAALLERWNRVKLLRHPHLLEIDTAGTGVIRGEPVAYVVREHAEENLGEILQERPLTTDETRVMLLQVASALDYLHVRGMVHGDVTASNIVALGDTVKLSSDSIREGDPAPDLRGLGLTLIHALTQRPDAAAKLPPPFGTIAQGCLVEGPARWTAERVIEAARTGKVSAPAREKKATSPGLRRFAVPVGIAAVALAAGTVVVTRRGDEPSRAAVESPAAVVTPAPAPATPPAEIPAPPPAAPKSAPAPSEPAATRDRMVFEDGVVRRVAPKIAQSARNTLDGRPVVQVRVGVDAAGDVTKAVVERTFSPYFGKLTLDAARQWKFVAQDGPNSRDWLLRFQFSKADTKMTARRVNE